MTNECKDRDLLAVEPSVFTGGGFESQQLAAGEDGVIVGTAFSSPSASFVTAKIEPGMVLCAYSTVPAEARACEIVSVNSPTSLTVSALRCDRDGAAIPPPGGSNLSYYINSFGPQIAAAQATLYEKLRRISEAEGIIGAEYADSAQLRLTVAFAALAHVFVARASNATANDANWIKSVFYRRQHLSALSAIRLAKDCNGDGVAEQTRTVGNVSLRRV